MIKPGVLLLIECSDGGGVVVNIASSEQRWVLLLLKALCSPRMRTSAVVMAAGCDDGSAAVLRLPVLGCDHLFISKERITFLPGILGM